MIFPEPKLRFFIERVRSQTGPSLSQENTDNLQSIIVNLCYSTCANIHYNLAMKPISFIILCSLFVIYIHSQACPNVYLFEHSTCAFHFTSSDNCAAFNFSFCTWQPCNSWGSTSNNQCARSTQLSSYDWNECTANCYNSSLKYPQSWDSLSQCQTYINLKQTESPAASSAIIITIVLIVVVCVCCICSCCRGGIIAICCDSLRECLGRLPCCKCWKHAANVSSVDHNISHEGLPGNSGSGGNEVRKNENEWIYVSPFEGKEGNESLEAIICCICLENRPTLELECGHKFHKLCIKQCLKKKIECPLCRTKNIGNIRLYCESCIRAYLCSTLCKHFSHRVRQSLVCPKCVQAGEVKA